MFCDRCGSAAQSDQHFCSRCGREFAGAPLIAYPRRGRVQEHIRLLAILWMAISAFNAVGASVVFILANTFFFHVNPDAGPPMWLHPFLNMVAILILAKAVAGFIVAWGLLRRERWARIATIVVGFLALFNVPFGTALGIYTLWVLLPAQSGAEYSREVQDIAAA